MKTITQSKQREAQKLLASLVPAHLAPEKSFAYVVNRTKRENVMRGAPPRISFIADSAEFVRAVLSAMNDLDYETGFALLVRDRAFEVVQHMPDAR